MRRARDVLFWPGMSAQVKDFISKCATCNEFSHRQAKEPLLNHTIPTRPWSKLAIDLFVFEGVNYIVLVDYFSDFLEVAKLTDITSFSVIEFCKQQFARHGIPDILVSDNGRQFVSSEFAEFVNIWQFTHVTTSPYHSQSNGKAESAVKIVKTIIKKSKRDKKELWLCILDWRNTPTEDMNTSPAQRLFSRRTKTVLPTTSELLAPKIEKGKDVKSLLTNKRKKAKRYYDRNAHTLRELRVGEFVRVQPVNPKQVWKLGTIVLQYAPRSYVIEVDGRLLTRNRKFLRTTSETPGVVYNGVDVGSDGEGVCMDGSDGNSSESASSPPAFRGGESVPTITNFKHTRTRIIRPPVRFRDYTMS